MFNIAKFSLYLAAQQEAYVSLLMSRIENSNPNWKDNIPKDLFDKPVDGNTEEINTKVQELFSQMNPVDITEDEVYKLFLVDKELLDKFITK